MATEEELIRKLARAIAQYLTKNPQAADDVEGIMRWWLPQEEVGITLERLRAAVELLKKEGVMIESVLPDGHTIFGRATRRPPGAARRCLS